MVLRGDAQVPFAKDPAAKQKPNVPMSAFAHPIEIMVVPLTLAKITMGQPTGGSIKLGASGEMLVKVDRQHDYAGEFKVKYNAPMGAMGISVDDVTIPAGKDEVKLVIKAKMDAKPGAVNGGSVVITGMYAGKYPVTQEVKVNITIAK